MRSTTTTDHPAHFTRSRSALGLQALAARAEAFTYPALRIVAGAMFAFHGAQKTLGWHSTFTPAVGSQLWIGGMLELFGGTLIALGLFTRPAAFIVSGMMAVAYIQFHWKGAFGEGKWLPAINKGELAALYCFAFLFIASRGPGRAALGNLLGRPRRARGPD